jgi:hypothetical protein
MPDDFRVFRSALLESLEGTGLPVGSGEARVILSGSSMNGFSSKGGQFRWSSVTDARGNVRAASDYDIKVVVPRDVFNQWVESSIAAQPTERMRKALRHYIGKTEGLRWAELPPSFRDALRPLMERYPRLQQVTIALEGGYWHVGDPMADATRMELTEGLIRSDLVCEAPRDAAGPRVVSEAGLSGAGSAETGPRVVQDTTGLSAPNDAELESRRLLEAEIRRVVPRLAHGHFDGAVRVLANEILRGRRATGAEVSFDASGRALFPVEAEVTRLLESDRRAMEETDRRTLERAAIEMREDRERRGAEMDITRRPERPMIPGR